MSAPVVALSGLRHDFGGDRAAVDLGDLVIPEGTTALLGPNGAGKTTLLRLLATIAAVQSGTIRIGGLDPMDHAERTALRRRTGFAMHSDRLPDRMRVGDFCDYIAALKEIGPRRRRRRWTDWVLAEVGLEDQRRERIARLSGGMRRRLVLAQSLLGAPDLLLLDEPLVSLDAHWRSQVIRSIAASAATRTTIVATHHVDELASVCRTVLVMTDGQLRFAGSPSQLAAHANGRTFEVTSAVAHPTARAAGPDRFRVVDFSPPNAVEVEPTAHDGYLAVIADASGG